MRLIDADALSYEILSEYGADGGAEDVNTIYGMIINAPTIDAEPVVRCKDCKYLERNYCDEYGDLEPLFCKNWVAGVDEDGYCYEAERREP